MLNEYIHPFTWLRTDWPWCFLHLNIRLVSFLPQHNRKSEKDRGRATKPRRVPMTTLEHFGEFLSNTFVSITEQSLHFPICSVPGDLSEVPHLWVSDTLNLPFNRIFPVFNNPPNNHRVKIIHFYLVNASRTFKRLPGTGRTGLV